MANLTYRNEVNGKCRLSFVIPTRHLTTFIPDRKLNHVFNEKCFLVRLTLFCSSFHRRRIQRIRRHPSLVSYPGKYPGRLGLRLLPGAPTLGRGRPGGGGRRRGHGVIRRRRKPWWRCRGLPLRGVRQRVLRPNGLYGPP